MVSMQEVSAPAVGNGFSQDFSFFADQSSMINLCPCSGQCDRLVESLPSAVGFHGRGSQSFSRLYHVIYRIHIIQIQRSKIQYLHRFTPICRIHLQTILQKRLHLRQRRHLHSVPGLEQWGSLLPATVAPAAYPSVTMPTYNFFCLKQFWFEHIGHNTGVVYSQPRFKGSAAVMLEQKSTASRLLFPLSLIFSMVSFRSRALLVTSGRAS